MKGYRKGGGYHSKGSYGDGLGAAHKMEMEDRVNYRPSMKADKGESGPMRHAGRDGSGASVANGGKTSQGKGPIHPKFNVGNNSTGRGHQAHIRGEHKKY